MSRFMSYRHASLVPYTPGEQPQNMEYVKLNTNESPFPPSEKAVRAAEEEALRLQLYSDPNCTTAVKKLAEVYGIKEDQILFTNGSDEVLNFAFMAFCDDRTGAAFADITYGFYPVYAEINHVDALEIPLNEELRINIEDYKEKGRTIFIANPNAPTGEVLTTSEIEEIIKSNPDNIVVVDEAYVDFGAESMVSFIDKYDNLLVVQTFSKSRSMAGARLGVGIGNSDLIRDLNTIKYSTNPYNVNRMTMAAGAGALSDQEYTLANCRTIMDNRSYTADELTKLGFTMTDSLANFIFVKHSDIDGGKLYRKLKEKGVLVRHFDKKRISDYIRVTIGTREQMDIFLEKIREILKEERK